MPRSWNRSPTLSSLSADEVPGLQVYPYLNSNPTPPSLDIYPGAPFQTGAGMGIGESQVFFTIRARVATADQESAMKLLTAADGPERRGIVEAAIADTAAVTPGRRLRVPRVHRGLRNQRPIARLRMEGERVPMTTYKVTTPTGFRGYAEGEEFEAELEPFLEERALEQGQIEVVKKNEEKGGGTDG